ncbi:MAG TPA: VOC family protein [Magnetospirillaceae bacterium]|jgi:catechol 2,3-dioxygenase
MSVSSKKIFRPRRLGHANLWVDDLARSEAFYNEVCGLAVEFTEPGLKASFLGTGNTPHDLGMIEVTGGKARYGRDGLLQLPEGIGFAAGLNHLAWEVENEVELVEGWKRATSANLPVHMTVDHQVAHSIYIGDPDGNEIEFYCDTVKDWRRVLHGEMDLITSAWTPGQEEPFADPRYDINPEVRHVDQARVHPHRVTHVVLVTQNIDRMSQFYARIGGMDVVHTAAGGRVFFMRGSHDGYRYNLAICEGEQNAYHHISFELESDKAVAEAERRLREVGIKPERSIDNDWKRSFFLIDPDGLRSEYYAYRTMGFVAFHDAIGEEQAYLV